MGQAMGMPGAEGGSKGMQASLACGLDPDCADDNLEALEVAMRWAGAGKDFV
eukprot:CAMPEP_0119286642 /NCGR_PEP_ID=MMETSP1329-20130426/34194_1 /TAXON_ID=114041 /ORGANISM="Genus nov. species nov., Strain RCC1024" /LENGTH=51 /DNA_ID=CAMNT_0007287385 /DNA_START=112 /DNA_END=264 /DNA_ORIENTATION=-